MPHRGDAGRQATGREGGTVEITGRTARSGAAAELATASAGDAGTALPTGAQTWAGAEARTEEIIHHLFALVDRLRASFDATVARFDLSPPQAKALRYLAHAGPVPMRELAGRLRCDASNVTGIVDRLEHRGLVERRPAPQDRRVKSLVVTGEGARLAEEVWSDVVGGALALVSLSDREQHSLLLLLRRLDQASGTVCWVGDCGCI